MNSSVPGISRVIENITDVAVQNVDDVLEVGWDARLP